MGSGADLELELALDLKLEQRLELELELEWALELERGLELELKLEMEQELEFTYVQGELLCKGCFCKCWSRRIDKLMSWSKVKLSSLQANSISQDLVHYEKLSKVRAHSTHYLQLECKTLMSRLPPSRCPL